jgi:glycosyltransferase involved in cell wall biosynthesis
MISIPHQQSDPLISVIIPTFNRADLLSATLHSLASQDPNRLEIIVVDDGSTDHTERAVAECGLPVRFLNQNQRGPGAARNLGWDAAQGDYVAFLDSDDVWFPWTLATYQYCLRIFDRPSFVLGTAHWFEQIEELTTAKETPLNALIYRDYFASALDTLWIGASSMLVKRDCASRFESERINAEDLDLAMHLGTENRFAWIREPATFGYRKHGNSAVSNFDKTRLGIFHLIKEEKVGRYPGGSKRRIERLNLITRSTRPPALEALLKNQPITAIRIYLQTLRWNVALRRWKFIFGFPGVALAHWMPRNGKTSTVNSVQDVLTSSHPVDISYEVSVIVPTKNRKELLFGTLQSIEKQTIKCEILVIDDASTDGTAEMVATHFPNAHYERRNESGGPTACRNQGAFRASGAIIVTLDDDCVFCSETSLEDGLKWLDRPELAAITLPFVNVRQDDVLRTAAPNSEDRFATLDFYGGMVAFRRDRFLEAGGYRTSYFMHWEEYDLAVRLLQAGYLIGNGKSEVIHHLESPVRNKKKLWRLGARNSVLFVIYNVPFPFLPAHLAVTVIKTFLYALRRGAAREVLIGFANALSASLSGWRMRKPLSIKVYNVARWLKKSGPQTISKIAQLLPRMKKPLQHGLKPSMY